MSWKSDIAEWAKTSGKGRPNVQENILLSGGWDPEKYTSSMKSKMFDYLSKWHTLELKTMPGAATEKRRNPYRLNPYRRNSDEAFRAAEIERRNLGLTAVEYIKYLLNEEETGSGLQYAYHSEMSAPKKVSDILNGSYNSAIVFVPIIFWDSLDHADAYEGDFNSFSFGDGYATLVTPQQVIDEIRRNTDSDPDIEQLIQELDSLNLRGVLIGF